MTGFLCALGGVCLQKKSPSRPMMPATSHTSLSSVSIGGNVPDSRKSSSNVVPATAGQEPRQYCPVTQ